MQVRATTTPRLAASPSLSCPSPVVSAPRRRYAKKVGDKWGVTNDGGDFPIYFLTFAGLAAVTYFTLVVVPQL